jgi:hypothetical protein
MDHDAQAKPAPANRPGGGRRNDTRELGRVVRRYLGALEASRSSRGKRRTIEGISARLLKIDELLVSADSLTRLHLTQERIDLHAELVRITNGQDPDLSSAEKEFVQVARQYGHLAGVTYAAWRQVGVDAEVLEHAGIMRTAPARPDASRVRRTADQAGPGLDTEPLLPRTDPIPALVEPELPLVAAETVAAETVASEAAASEPLLATGTAADVAPPAPPAPKKPARAKAPPQNRRPKAAADAQDAPAEAAPAPDGDEGAPKLRRKRIAD